MTVVWIGWIASQRCTEMSVFIRNTRAEAWRLSLFPLPAVNKVSYGVQSWIYSCFLNPESLELNQNCVCVCL